MTRMDNEARRRGLQVRGRALAGLRMERGKSVRTCAMIANVAPEQWQAWENGAEVLVYYLEGVCDALDMDPGALLRVFEQAMLDAGCELPEPLGPKLSPEERARIEDQVVGSILLRFGRKPEGPPS